MSILGDFIALEISHYLHAAYHEGRYVHYRFVRPNMPVRVSFAAIIRLEKDGRFLLLKTPRRPEGFGPVGGVYKYHESATSALDSLEFQPEVAHRKMAHDLRGVVPRRHLGGLISWFLHEHDRETARDCLLREMREELAEAGLGITPPAASEIQLRRVRQVTQSPHAEVEGGLLQFRIIDVYEFASRHAVIAAFIKALFRASGPNIVTATADEIIRGRCATNELVHANACYLSGNRLSRPNSLPFVGS